MTSRNIMKPKHLFALLLTVVLVSGVDARTRKGDKLLKDGRAAEAKGDWDAALTLYEQAVDQDQVDDAAVEVEQLADESHAQASLRPKSPCGRSSRTRIRMPKAIMSRKCEDT